MTQMAFQEAPTGKGRVGEVAVEFYVCYTIKRVFSGSGTRPAATPFALSALEFASRALRSCRAISRPPPPLRHNRDYLYIGT